MPLPKRYAKAVSDVTSVWAPEGYFKTQTRIWLAQAQARNELYNEPSDEQLDQIKKALNISSEDLEHLIKDQGHETNRLLRLVQSRLPKELGNFIHKGNTGSDVLDTSLSLQIIDSLEIIKADFNQLLDSLKKLALEHKNTLQVGRTHGQHAIPQTFGRQVLGWYAEVKRGVERIEKAKDIISYGKCSGEIGTNVFVEPELEEMALAKLNLRPDAAPTQVISRDRHAEVVCLMSVTSNSLARIATNIRLLSMTDIGELREPFDKEEQQGSSAMPHKKNPELAERISGICRWVSQISNAELESVNIWLERDISHSSTERFVFPDVFGGLSYATRTMQKIIDGIIVDPERMLENLNKTYGSIYSPRLLNALIEKGKSRTEAYELSRDLAQEAMDNKIQLKELALENESVKNLLSDAEIEELFDPKFYLRNIEVAFKRIGL